jgi:hypothetical protein
LGALNRSHHSRELVCRLNEGIQRCTGDRREIIIAEQPEINTRRSEANPPREVGIRRIADDGSEAITMALKGERGETQRSPHTKA